MAANLKAELKDVESVMQFYRMHTDKPMWVVYSGVSMTNVCYDYINADQPDEGDTTLNELLDLLKKDPSNTNVYTLQLVDSFREFEKGGITKREYTGKAMRFQLNQPQPYNVNNQPIIIKDDRGNIVPTGSSGEVVELLKIMLQEQKEENNKLRELLEQREEETEDEQEEDTQIGATPELTTNEKIIGVVTKLAEREEVQEAIAGILVGAQKWFNKKVLKDE